jgi:hypothetical protein
MSIMCSSSNTYLRITTNRSSPFWQCCGSGSYVFGPPGSGSNSTRYGSGSRSGFGSFHNQAKIPTVL